MRLSIALYGALALFASDGLAVTSPPLYSKSPVFFELVREGYVDSSNDELLPQGKLHLAPFEVQDINRFNWTVKLRKDRSWWLRVERFDYLLSLIESDDDHKRRVAASWFSGWYEAHKGGKSPNEAAWDGMTAGYRAAVFVRYLKLEERRPRPAPILDKLRNTIREHQKLLADKRSFEANSNHGMWNAMGLFETTRVFPNDEYAAIALERIMDLTNRSLSKEGVHREHAPSYHFYFLRMLDEYTRYLTSINGWTWEGEADLTAERDRMRSVSYFMFDHRRRIPRIGDSGGAVDEDVAEGMEPPSGPPWLYDPEAGYAIAKDSDSAPSHRYVVFSIQNAENPTNLVAHFHRDATAVYYSNDGEIILGDQGRYSFTPSLIRDYFVSASAHNALFPEEFLRDTAGTPFVASRAWIERGKESVTFGVAAYGREVTRELEIPENQSEFVVTDRILGDRHFVALWNLGPDVTMARAVKRPAKGGEQRFRWVLTTKRNRRFALDIAITGNATPAGDVVHKVRGIREPMLGWYATGFEAAIPSDVLRIDLKPKGLLRMTTRVEELTK